MSLTMLKVLFQSPALAFRCFCDSLCLQSSYFAVVPRRRGNVRNIFVTCAWLTTTHDEYCCHGITARLLTCIYIYKFYGNFYFVFCTNSWFVWCGHSIFIETAPLWPKQLCLPQVFASEMQLSHDGGKSSISCGTYKEATSSSVVFASISHKQRQSLYSNARLCVEGRIETRMLRDFFNSAIQVVMRFKHSGWMIELWRKFCLI